MDHVESIFKLTNKGNANITINQLRDFFDDIGFKGDVTFSEVHGSDNANWMNFINPAEAVRSHLIKGTGDYILGFKIMEKVFDLVLGKFKQNKNIFVEIDPIYQELVSKKNKYEK